MRWMIIPALILFLAVAALSAIPTTSVSAHPSGCNDGGVLTAEGTNAEYIAVDAAGNNNGSVCVAPNGRVYDDVASHSHKKKGGKK
jgi:hypothetical protein